MPKTPTFKKVNSPAVTGLTYVDESNKKGKVYSHQLLDHLQAFIKEELPHVSPDIELTHSKSTSMHTHYATVKAKSIWGSFGCVVEVPFNTVIDEPYQIACELIQKLKAEMQEEIMPSPVGMGMLPTREGMAKMIEDCNAYYGEDMTPQQLADAMLLRMATNTLHFGADKPNIWAILATSKQTGHTNTEVRDIGQKVLQSIAKRLIKEIEPE